jgi:hypothetical protein
MRLFAVAIALALLALFAIVVLKARDLNDFANLVRELVS